MKRNTSNHDLIERYLLNQLSDQKMTEFRLRLMRDKELQAEVEAVRLLMKTVKSRSKMKVGKSGGNSELPPDSSNKTLLAVLAILIVGALGFFLFNNLNSETPASEVENNVVETPEISEGPVLSDEKPAEMPLSEETIETPPPPEKSVETPAKPAPEKPVAAVVNYDPNPALEKYVGSRLRGNEYEFFVELSEALPQKDNRILFNISGKVETENSEIDDRIIIRLFTNKKEDYEESRPVRTWELSFKPDGEDFRFSVNESVETNKGLYYFLIENPREGMFYFVGKIRVE